MLPTVFIPEQRSSNTLSTAHALETKKARLKAGLKRRGYSAGIIASADSSDLQLIKTLSTASCAMLMMRSTSCSVVTKGGAKPRISP